MQAILPRLRATIKHASLHRIATENIKIVGFYQQNWFIFHANFANVQRETFSRLC